MVSIVAGNSAAAALTAIRKSRQIAQAATASRRAASGNNDHLSILLPLPRHGRVCRSPRPSFGGRNGSPVGRAWHRFLLFDIGLHFSTAHVRREAGDIFGFGPLQLSASTILIGGCAWALGLSPIAALVVGTTLALSSTAIVAGVIADRRQQNCPVALTAIAILIFQDVAAIFLLILTTTLEARHGVLGRVGITDRGMASAKNLAWLRDTGRRYIIGAPKSEPKNFGVELPAAAGWRTVQA